MEGGQVVQQPVGDAAQQVLVEMQVGGASRESDGQRRGEERPAAAVHLRAVAGAMLGAGGGPEVPKHEEETEEEKTLHGCHSLEGREEKREERLCPHNNNPKFPLWDE